MAEQYVAAIPEDTLDQLSALYEQAPEPVNGKTHEPGRYQVQIEGDVLRQQPGKGKHEGTTFTILTTTLKIIGPDEKVTGNPLKDVIEIDRFLKTDEDSMTNFKRDVQARDLDPKMSLSGVLAAFAAQRGQFWEIDVTHTPKKDRDSGKPSTTDFWQNVRFLRNLNS